MSLGSAFSKDRITHFNATSLNPEASAIILPPGIGQFIYITACYRFHGILDIIFIECLLSPSTTSPPYLNF